MKSMSKIMHGIISSSYYYLKRMAIRRDVFIKDRHFIDLMRQNGLRIRQLSSEQKKAVDEVYGKYKCLRVGGYNYRTHELYYTATEEFSPFIVPHDLFRCFICPLMNSTLHTQTWRDKNYYDVYLPNGRFPEVIVRNSNGYFYDKDFNLLTPEAAYDIVASAGKYIIKPTLASASGNGVRKTNVPLKGLIAKYKYKKDFIVQKPLKQHHALSELNESSVNVIRVMTIFIDDSPEYLCASVRVGNKGSIIDYSPDSRGRGNIICGLDKTGRLAKTGYQPCGLKSYCTANGTVLEMRFLPNFDKVIDMALTSHARMPFFRFIAWDMVIDENGEPVIMEYNLLNPGIMYYQWTNGPLFGTDINRIHYIIDKLTSTDI